MLCSTGICENQAVYRTMGDKEILLLCLTCTELALDMGRKPEEMTGMPTRAA